MPLNITIKDLSKATTLNGIMNDICYHIIIKTLHEVSFFTNLTSFMLIVNYDNIRVNFCTHS